MQQANTVSDKRMHSIWTQSKVLIFTQFSRNEETNKRKYNTISDKHNGNSIHVHMQFKYVQCA